jgi:hypothetical protein
MSALAGGRLAGDEQLVKPRCIKEGQWLWRGRTHQLPEIEYLVVFSARAKYV